MKKKYGEEAWLWCIIKGDWGVWVFFCGDLTVTIQIHEQHELFPHFRNVQHLFNWYLFGRMRLHSLGKISDISRSHDTKVDVVTAGRLDRGSDDASAHGALSPISLSSPKWGWGSRPLGEPGLLSVDTSETPVRPSTYLHFSSKTRTSSEVVSEEMPTGHLSSAHLMLLFVIEKTEEPLKSLRALRTCQMWQKKGPKTINRFTVYVLILAGGEEVVENTFSLVWKV